MSSFVKTKLKAARDAIGKKEYEKAKDAALGVLEYEPENYNANVFLGLALLNLGQVEQSEQAYRRAIEISPDQILAWQGLSRLYEQATNWEKYTETLQHLAELFSAAADATKCAETLEKIIDLRRDPDKGTPTQLADVLFWLLPDSPFYAVLSTLPPPDPTNPSSTTTFIIQTAIHDSLPVLEELTAIFEHEEKSTIEREVAKRRTRLGAAGPEQLRSEVGVEVLGSSRLPKLYDEILNHPNTSDELRRATESKLLRHKERYLYVLPASGESAARKAQIAAELADLVNGMVLLGIPDDLAWTLFIEAKDAGSVEQYDFHTLRKFAKLFPSLPMAQSIQGYFGYMGIPISDEEEEDIVHNQTNEQDEDFVDTVTDALGSLPDSLLAHLVAAEVYKYESDLENAMKVAESGLALARITEQKWGKTMPLNKKAFNVILATSLVQYFPPKHHPRALDIITQVLKQDPDNIECLMGRGYILQHSGKCAEAAELFKRVTELLPDDLEHGLRAREEHAWCCAMDDPDGGAKALQEVISVLDTLEGKEDDQARCWWRLGRCYWDMGDHCREEAYKHFITSLKRSSAFAPAFTSLGIYYLEFISPADPDRASKCFQKAFELDPREVEAARRLAEGFAEEREWDLVEVVARRTIEGEGGVTGGSSAVAAARYLPVNAWAWKAVGVVELNRQHYAPAIQAFQIALRADVDDQLSWLRLGEAYSKAGRFAAAVKALERAHQLDPDDWICSYFTGEVQRQTGDHAAAIDAFKSILVSHPDELGVMVSLGQAYLDLGRVELAAAYTARAEASFTSSLDVTLGLIRTSPGFRRIAWKTAADAVFHLSQFSSFSEEEAVRGTLIRLIPLLSDHPAEGISGIISWPLSVEASLNLPLSILEVAIAAYDCRLSLGSLNDSTLASACFDLGAALVAYARKVGAMAKIELARQSATGQFKDALRLEPTNDRYWNALANVTFASEPRTAQHAFIKALELDSKNTITWTNLGLFYLHHSDTELANEAFYKAQTLDPDYALAWVGQGLVATINGHHSDATALFEHATGLPSPVPAADLEYAQRLFKRLSASAQRDTPSDALIPGFFVLDRYCRKRPEDASALHLFGLVCERIGHLELAVEHISRAIALLEAAYEESEDSRIERQFTIAHSNMGRVHLAMSDYEGALESFQTAMGLLPEEPEEGATRVLLAQAQFGSGLANFKLGQLEDALSLFEAALGTAADDETLRGHVVVMLAQTLWAIGTAEGRESAKAQLLQSIEGDPDNLAAINTLAGMGILTDDDSLVDAALSEILALPIEQRLARDPGRDVPYLLTQHHLAQGDASRALSVAQHAVFAEPARADARRALATLVLQRGESGTALATLAAGGSSGSREDSMAQLRESLALRVAALCRDGRGAEARRLAQKAVMLSPWGLRDWQALGYAESGMGS